MDCFSTPNYLSIKSMLEVLKTLSDRKPTYHRSTTCAGYRVRRTRIGTASRRRTGAAPATDNPPRPSRRCSRGCRRTCTLPVTTQLEFYTKVRLFTKIFKQDWYNHIHIYQLKRKYTIKFYFIVFWCKYCRLWLITWTHCFKSAHLNCDARQETGGQSASSCLSKQSSSPSHTHDAGIQWPVRGHVNYKSYNTYI